MRLTSIVLTVLLACVVQVALARYTVGGGLAFDVVLVATVLTALQWGPVAGMLSGTLGGLLQDLLSGEIVGVGGLAKTLVGCAAGVVGTQFVLVHAHLRMLIVALATLVHRGLILSVRGLIDQDWPGAPWGAMLAEVGINAAVAFLVFHATSTLPGIMARQRLSRRSGLSRRQW